MIARSAVGTAAPSRPGFIGRWLARDLWRAFAHPRRAWNSLHHWTLLARHAQVPYAEILRYRRELIHDDEFQGHIERHLGHVGYVTSGPELYVLVRATKPGVIVETGVASGVSSAHILRALAANGTGTLYSIDLPNVQEGSELPEGRSCGWIVPEAVRDRWQLQLGDSRELLPKLLERLGRVDFFFHDSDHSYESMRFELERAVPRLIDGGVLVSDDTHLHTAWDDVCVLHGLRPTRLGRLGVTRKRGSRR